MSQKLNTITNLESKINTLNDIKEWSERLNKIVEIKKEIDNETKNINNILETLDEPKVPTKEYNINKIINDFSKVDISKKIKYYQYLNNHIKNIENELFN
jgi:hypothetical protein